MPKARPRSPRLWACPSSASLDSSLFDLMRMARELEALFGRAVDVVSAAGLKSRDRAILALSVDL
jgi:predicted nucleotidyltransferase